MFSSFNKKLFFHIDAWVEKNIISQAQALQIKSLYPEKEKVNFFWLSSLLACVFFGLGLIYLVGYNWDGLTRLARSLIAISIVVFSSLLNLLALKRGNANFKEGAGILWALSFGAAFAIISQSFHLSGDTDKFIFWLLVLCSPVLFISNSKILGLIYALIASFWLADTKDFITFATTLIPWILNYVLLHKQKQSVFLANFGLIALFISIVYVCCEHNFSSLTYCFCLLFGFFFFAGEFFYKRSFNPFTISSTIFCTMLVFFGEGVYYFYKKDFSLFATIAMLIVFACMFVFWLYKKREFEKAFFPSIILLFATMSFFAHINSILHYLLIVLLVIFVYLSAKKSKNFYRFYSILLFVSLIKLTFSSSSLLIKSLVLFGFGLALIVFGTLSRKKR